MSEDSVTLDRETRIEVPEEVLFRDLEGEAVVLHTGTGNYFGLNGTGTRMWSLLAEHGRVGPALDALLEEFQVDASTLRRDLLTLLAELEQQGLMRLRRE